MNEERGTRNAERRTGRLRWLALAFLVPCSAFFVQCKTVGVSMTSGGYAEVSPTIANEMILDSRQVVILDVRPAGEYRGAEGHIAGALSAPFDSIERQLPELLPYQNQTVLIYGNGESDGAVAARLLIVAGFRNVVHIAGGLQGWIEHGYRTVNAQ
jgi:rhodanese-related sulfurtransferase